MSTYGTWVSEAWRAEATAWLDARLAELGRERTGPVEQPRARPWGTVLRAPTSDGPVWLKAPARSLAFELPLLTILTGRDGAPTVLGVDPERGWVLLADAGTSFREHWPDHGERAGPFAAAWPTVARLQRATMPHLPDLLAAGVVDMRPASLPARFDESLARARRDHGADPDDAALLGRVAAARPGFVRACASLDTSRVPPAVDHNDLHDGNLMVDAAGRSVVVDWGDAVLAHPFATLLVAEQVLAALLGDVTPEHPAIVAARAAYLREFADLAPGEDLERTARAAVAVAHVARAWVWQRASDTFVDVEEFTIPPGWPVDFHRGALRHLEYAVDAVAALR